MLCDKFAMRQLFRTTRKQTFRKTVTSHTSRFDQVR